MRISTSTEESLDKLSVRLEERIDQFRLQVKRVHDDSWRLHRIYFWLHALVVLAGLMVAPAIMIVALCGHNLAAAILGGVMTVLLGIQAAFKPGEQSRQWAIMHRHAKMVEGRLESAPVLDEALFASMVASWEKLRMGLFE